MKFLRNYKKNIIGTALLTFIVGCAATPVTWSDPTVLNAFMQTCNPKNEDAMKAICECVVGKLKVTHPDASKADGIPASEIEAETKACIK